MPSTGTDSRQALTALEAADRFLVQQVFKPIANEYRISIPAPGSTEEGAPLLYVKQKRMKIKEDIRFRLAPDAERAPVHDQVEVGVRVPRPPRGARRATGNVIGMLEKDFGQSLLRSHWHVRDAAGELLFEAHEASWLIALVRRFAELGPDGSSCCSYLPFNFVLLRDGEQVGSYKRVLGKLRDRYVLELDPGSGRRPAAGGRVHGRARRAAGPLAPSPPQVGGGTARTGVRSPA